MIEKSQTFDVRRAMANPSAFFAQPADVLTRPGLSRTTKMKLLRHWEHDARNLAVAEGEGMSGGEESMLGRVLDAIQALERGNQPAPDNTAQIGWWGEARNAAAFIIGGTRSHPVTGLLLAAMTGYVLGRARSRN